MERWKYLPFAIIQAIEYLPLGGQRAGDGEERIQPALCAALSALHNLLTAITDPVLTAPGCTSKHQHVLLVYHLLISSCEKHTLSLRL